MKTSLFSVLAAAFLFTSSAAFADAHDHDRRYDDRNSKDFNYGYDRSHRVTPAERARWEAEHRYDRRDNDFDRNHRVTASENTRWEAQQREAQLRLQREAQQREEQQKLERLRQMQQQETQRRAAQQRAQYEAARQHNHR